MPLSSCCCSAPSNAPSTWVQSTAAPSDTAAPSAISAGSSGRSLMPHLGGETNEGAADGDADGGCRRAAGQIGDVLVIEPELDPSDDQLAIRLAQPLQRHIVAREQLPSDGTLERRRIERRLLDRELLARRATDRPAHRVPQPVAERLTDVGAERPFVLGGE